MIRPAFAALATAASLLLPLAAAPALAQEATPAAPPQAPVANGQQFGNWTVSCAAVAVNTTACVLNQQLVRDSDRTFMAQVMALWAAGGDQSYLAMRVPLGTYLAAGIAMRNSASEEVFPLVWQSCGPQFCEALMELTPEVVETLTAGDAMIVASYRPQMTAEPRIFNFSIAGLKDGLAALHPSN